MQYLYGNLKHPCTALLGKRENITYDSRFYDMTRLCKKGALPEPNGSGLKFCPGRRPVCLAEK